MTIDGVNILATYSATLLYGSLAKFIQHPPLKKPLSNDWAEFDGLEVDLEAPVLNKRDVKVTFLIEEASIDSFIAFLMLKTYRDYHSIDLNKTYKLRCEEITNINKPQGKCSISVKLVDDFPLSGYIYQEPFLSARDTGITIDSKNVLEYGLIGLYGTEMSLDSIVKSKKKLEVSNKYSSGVVVTEQASKKQHFQANLRFGIHQTPINFWKGYDAFLYDLVQPIERTLVINGNVYTFYYVSTEVSNFVVLDGTVWCNFNVKIEVL